MLQSAEPDFKIVTTGRNRLVVLIGPYTLKLPSLRCRRDLLFGLLNNLDEAAYFRDKAVPAACPVLWCAPGGWLLVMPRARPLTVSEFAKIDHLALAGDRVGVEHKVDSYGHLRGSVVVLDYGW